MQELELSLLPSNEAQRYKKLLDLAQKKLALATRQLRELEKGKFVEVFDEFSIDSSGTSSEDLDRKEKIVGVINSTMTYLDDLKESIQSRLLELDIDKKASGADMFESVALVADDFKVKIPQSKKVVKKAINPLLLLIQRGKKTK